MRLCRRLKLKKEYSKMTAIVAWRLGLFMTTARPVARAAVAARALRVPGADLLEEPLVFERTR